MLSLITNNKTRMGGKKTKTPQNTCTLNSLWKYLQNVHNPKENKESGMYVTNWETIRIQAKYSGSLHTSEHSDNLVLGRQTVTERIMKICPTWRLKEESKWKTSSPYLSNVKNSTHRTAAINKCFTYIIFAI